MWPDVQPLLTPTSLLPSQDAGSQQIGFLLGSCGVTVALTSDACHKGLPKSPTGEIPQFKGTVGSPCTASDPEYTLHHECLRGHVICTACHSVFSLVFHGAA